MTQVYDHELINWNGARVGIAAVDGERWAVKPEGRLEALGYQLGRGLVNVAEVRLGPELDGEMFARVRLAENYTPADLPIADLDEAVAAELVFSLWIRRRDTHAYNRAYVAGIPMFFDHGAAFDTERGIDQFVREGPDNGYVPTWRAEEWAHLPTTVGTRWLNDATGLAVHPIRDKSRFLGFFDAWVQRLAGRAPSQLDAALRASGITGKGFASLRDFLRRSQEELPQLAGRVLEIAARQPLQTSTTSVVRGSSPAWYAQSKKSSNS